MSSELMFPKGFSAATLRQLYNENVTNNNMTVKQRKNPSVFPLCWAEYRYKPKQCLVADFADNEAILCTVTADSKHIIRQGKKKRTR